MGLFFRKRTPEQIGEELAGRLNRFVAAMPDILSSIQDGKLFALDDVDRRGLIWESIILTYVGQRLAVQLSQRKGVNRDIETRKRICAALDTSASAFLENSTQFNDLLDKRGRQYFELLQSHASDFGRGDSKAFLEALQFKFEQFCRAGEGQNDDYIVIGDFRSLMPLKMLAVDCWSAGFLETLKYIRDQLD